MPSIFSIDTATPLHVVEADMLDAITREWFEKDEETRKQFLRLCKNSGVQRRSFVLPYREILTLDGFARRAELFEQHGLILLNNVLERMLARCARPPQDFSHFVMTSCSVPVIPSLDAAAVLNSALSPHIKRIPIFQHGCAGGVAGLSLAAQLSALGRPVIVSAVEICSLVFHPRDRTGEQLVGAAIFGDGAALAVVSPESNGLRIVDTQSCLVPNTREVMGYNLRDDGLYLRLDRTLPSTLAEYAPGVVQRFLARSNLAVSDVDYWLIHPGGRKILDFFVEGFALADHQYTWARDVLREHGNLSSATILFVLERFMRAGVMQEGQRALVLGIGPGLTIELMLLQG